MFLTTHGADTTLRTWFCNAILVFCAYLFDMFIYMVVFSSENYSISKFLCVIAQKMKKIQLFDKNTTRPLRKYDL